MKSAVLFLDYPYIKHSDIKCNFESVFFIPVQVTYSEGSAIFHTCVTYLGNVCVLQMPEKI